MRFINRKQELKRLNQLSQLPKSTVAVIWGRRRMGKTRLLLEWIVRQKGVYYASDESSAPIQRKYFSMALEPALPQFSQVDYPDWISFFSKLAKEAEQANWRGPIVIDELPYLISVSPELPSILQKFIDHDAKKAKLTIALCGSSQRMMQGAILEPSAPLYGRANEIFKIGPIAVNYLQDALAIRDPVQLIEWYSIWGGIPRYWELLEDRSPDFLDAIDQLVLDPMGPLNDEPNRLLLEELPSAIHLRPMLDAIGLGAHRLSEIAARVGQQATSLARPLQRLIELDLVYKETPFGESPHNSKKTLYKIKDPFVRFWFTVIAPKRSLLVQAPSKKRKQWVKESLPTLFAQTWEELCRSAVPLLSETWGGSEFLRAERYWHGKEHEWDVVAASEDQSTLLIGEAKWLQKRTTKSWILHTFEELKRKGVPPVKRRANARTKWVLFLPERPKEIMLPKEYEIIDAKTIMKAFSQADST